MKNINEYVSSVDTKFKSGISSEHTFRADLENLLRELTEGVEITNEPSKVTDCGNPDYVITKGKIPVGFIEAKDLGKDLNSKSFKEQFDRYRSALDNLIITDYLWFQFYQNGELVHEIRIGEIGENGVTPLTDNFDEFTNLIRDFVQYISQTIKSSKKLAEMMASKARLLENTLEKAVTSDEETQDNSSLKQQYQTFKEILIHDLTPSGFADIYAQTLAYGMFAARLHDPTLDDFSRQEAAELIPKSNPFLRKLFSHIGGVDIDDRIKTTVDNLADVFRATNIRELLKDFGKATQTQDPIIHFYETFLAEYNPKLRKARGVWYTPEPVVDFIVRGVDDILKTEFNLKDGLADIGKTTIEVEAQGTAVTKGRNKGKPLIETKEVHKVQVLDPATGTGTFLAAVIKFIYEKKFKAMQGAWSGYVEEHLVPRLNGFELLMASYSMAHLKLDMLLRETGYESKANQRFNIFLTNSLEEHHPDTGTLFSTWLSSEASEANRVKRDTPVMVIIGNPPYSGESANKGEWIMSLMDDYKKEPNTTERLKERNPKWINDDYVKFLRYGQHFIERNGEGVLAYICPHGFLDNPTFRGMRWNLLKTFDKIYVLDLHGNSKKKEVSPDGSPDVNVFDIMQGVSINFFIKTGEKKKGELAQVLHHDIYGEREFKYQFLNSNSIDSVSYKKLPNIAPMYFMVQKDFEAESQYKKGFSLDQLFLVSSIGVVTARDKFTIHDSIESASATIDEFLLLDDDDARSRFKLGKDVRDWKVSYARSDLEANWHDKSKLIEISYRPFEKKYTFFTGKSKGFHCYPRGEVMTNFIDKDNLGFVYRRQQPESRDLYIFCSKNVVSDGYIRSDNKGGESVAPLYIYPSKYSSDFFENESRKPNFNIEVIKVLEKAIGLNFVNEKEVSNSSFSPIDVFNYIYAVLHSTKYRSKYQNFLKIDFPKVPYIQDQDVFWDLVRLGGELCKIHLLESDTVEKYITTYPHNGNNIITRKIISTDWELYDEENQLGRIWINDDQCYDQIPLVAWEFYIGGYQPAQKWLKDRKERVLSFDDILHYQKIIVALNETHRIMQEIDKIEFE